MRFIGCLAFYLVLVFSLSAQDVKKAPGGVISGNQLDSISQKAITGASVLLTNLPEGKNYTQVTDKNGDFSFPELPFGYYRLSISSVGYATLKIDSINVRAERFDFNLPDIRLSTKSKDLESVIIYAEKPMQTLLR